MIEEQGKREKAIVAACDAAAYRAKAVIGSLRWLFPRSAAVRSLSLPPPTPVVVLPANLGNGVECHRSPPVSPREGKIERRRDCRPQRGVVYINRTEMPRRVAREADGVQRRRGLSPHVRGDAERGTSSRPPPELIVLAPSEKRRVVAKWSEFCLFKLEYLIQFQQ